MDTKQLALHHALHKGKPGSDDAGKAQLTYYIFEGILVGIVDSQPLHISALSGGGGGSTRNKPSDTANNPYQYGLKEVDLKFRDKTKNVHVHGGPIPPGRYRVLPPAHHEKLGLSAKLEPMQALPNDRGGFYIHGTGPHGSERLYRGRTV